MTIDSTYLGFQSRNVDFLDSVYMFPWETVTSSAILVKVTYVIDDTTYLVDVASSNYSIVLGGEEPIYYRGEVHFANPRDAFVNEDVKLLFGRKTPITQELDLIPYTPAPMESVEFSIDKLTMILQEIEGDKCDCPGGGSIPEEPVCVPVSLDSPLSPATTELSAYGQTVSWSAFAIGTAPFTYQWSLNGAEIPGATSSVFTTVITDESQTGTYTVQVTNPCGATTGSAQVLPAGCYACDAFSAFTGSLPGVHVYHPQSSLSSASGYLFLNGENMYPGGGTTGPALVNRQAGGFHQQITPTDGMLDSCGQVLGGRIGGWWLDASQSVKDIAQGGTFSSGILVDTATLRVGTSPTAWYTRAYYDPAFQEEYPNAIGSYDINLDLRCVASVGPPYGGGTTLDGKVNITVAYNHETPDPSVPPRPPGIQIYEELPDLYRFYRRASDEQFCNPLYISMAIIAGLSDVTVRFYAGFGYRENTGPITAEGLIAERTYPLTDPELYFLDVDNVRDVRVAQPITTGEFPVYYQDLWVGPNITTGQWTETLHQANRNMLVYGCDPESTCVPIVLTDIVESVGNDAVDFSVTEFPAELRVAVNKASNTTDQVLYQWLLNGVAITGQAESNSSLVYDIESEADIGNYSVTAVNACGSDSSSQQVTYDPPACEPVGIVTLSPLGQNYAYGEWPGVVSMSTRISGGGGSPPLEYEWYKDGDIIVDETGPTANFQMATDTDLGDYQTIIRNPCGSGISELRSHTMDACVPVAVDPLDPPSYDFTFFGETITWTAVATGSNPAGSPITYQWRKDGVDITGETSATFTKTFASEADTGLYSVLVTNDCGTANRGAAVNYTDPGVCEPPVVPQIEPADSEHDGEDPLPITWVASPTGTDSPMTYQWYFKQLFSSTYNEIVGETSDTLSVVVNNVNDYGYYLIIATNACGTDSSEAFVTGPV